MSGFTSAGDRDEAPSSATVAAEPMPRLRHHVLALVLAIAGGLVGAAGAFVEELRTGGAVLLPIIGAPIIEEVLKPVGIYLLLARWPFIPRGRLHIAALTAVSGLSFGLIEAAVYVTWYVPDHSQQFFVYRFTLPVLMHATASFVAGTGISRELLAWFNRGGRFPRRTRTAFLAAILLHAAYNSTAIALVLTGVID